MLWFSFNVYSKIQQIYIKFDIMSTEDEDVLLARAAEERERIFLKYERGREPGAEIDPWEDPGFEVYHAMDR